MSNQTYTPYDAFVDVMSRSEECTELPESERQEFLKTKWDNSPESLKDEFRFVAFYIQCNTPKELNIPKKT